MRSCPPTNTWKLPTVSRSVQWAAVRIVLLLNTDPPQKGADLPRCTRPTLEHNSQPWLYQAHLPGVLISQGLNTTSSVRDTTTTLIGLLSHWKNVFESLDKTRLNCNCVKNYWNIFCLLLYFGPSIKKYGPWPAWGRGGEWGGLRARILEINECAQWDPMFLKVIFETYQSYDLMPKIQCISQKFNEILLIF